MGRLPQREDVTLSPRHQEVLREAMELFAERGWAGASLRELARRLGVQQPSLYHYFRSKEELVEQILATYGFGGPLSVPQSYVQPEAIEDAPAALVEYVLALYRGRDWPLFVRFIFNLSLEERWRARLRVMFVDVTRELIREATRPYVESGQVTADDAAFLARMVTSAIALPLIEEHVLFRGAGQHPDMDRYAAWVAATCRAAIEARRAPAPMTREVAVARRARAAAKVAHSPARKSKNSRA